MYVAVIQKKIQSPTNFFFRKKQIKTTMGLFGYTFITVTIVKLVELYYNTV